MVYEGEYYGQPVAIKEMTDTEIQEDREAVEKEVEMFSQIRSPYIVSFFGTAVSSLLHHFFITSFFSNRKLFSPRIW